MANAKPATETPTCMTCGVPIKSGFFCARCASGDTPDQRKDKKDDGWKGSRFSGEAKKKKQQALLMEDLTIWGKRVVIVAVVGGLGYAGYALFGDRVKGMIHGAESVSNREKYDPTKDKTTSEDDLASGKNGTRVFSQGTK